MLLVDPLTLETIEVLEAGAESGSYSFRFEDIDEGEFLIIAGTDSDYDFLICDPGEACGAFPTTESIQSVIVESDRSLDFVTGFSIPVTGAATGPAVSSCTNSLARKLQDEPATHANNSASAREDRRRVRFIGRSPARRRT